MSNLIENLLGQNNVLYRLFINRLQEYIKFQAREISELVPYYGEEHWARNYIRDFGLSEYSELIDFVANEIYIDLIISYKNDDYRFKGQRELEKIINLTYIKYASYIRSKIGSFYSDLTKLRSKFKKEKWKIEKIKRVPRVMEPIRIALDTRFAIIKRANRKCENCSTSIFVKPIGVYQIQKEGTISFVAYCKDCCTVYQENILPEPEDRESQKDQDQYV